MYKQVALAVLRYTECPKVIVHFRTRVYQTQIVHFIKKLSETCLYSIKAHNYVNYSKWPPLMNFYIIETSKKEAIQMDRVSHLRNVPKRVLGRSAHLHTDMKAHGSYSDPDGGENIIAVRDNVHLKLEQQLPLNGPRKGRKSIILDNLDKFKAGLPVSKEVLQR